MMRKRMPDKKAYDQKWPYQALSLTTRHMAIKHWWWDNEILHFRHLQFDISPWLSSWNSSNSRNWGGGASFIGSDYWGQIFIYPSEVSELYKADPAVWNRTAEAKGNANEHYNQHPSNGSIKEVKAVASGLTERAAGTHGPLLTRANL